MEFSERPKENIDSVTAGICHVEELPMPTNRVLIVNSSDAFQEISRTHKGKFAMVYLSYSCNNNTNDRAMVSEGS